MATKNKDGVWEFTDDEQAEIEMGARTRLRADDLREERRLAKEKAEKESKCEKCGEAKHEGECKKKKEKTRRRFLG